MELWPAKPCGPCAGLRVLDFSSVVSGPMCTMILGDLGADVIKVEASRGDATRMMGPPFRQGLSAFFAQFNRNKRSAVVDLKHPEGRTIARRLADASDVVVQNLRPGVAERLGIDYATLSAGNPRLVYVAISGFGPEGPYVDQPAYDTVIQGLAGHMPVQGMDGPPQLIRSLVADKASALTATYAALAALLARERLGRGQMVDVPMLDAFAAFVLPDALLRETFLPSDEWQGLPDMSAAVHRTWQTADGHVVIMVIEDGQFHALCRVLDREDLVTDERFTSFPLRLAHWQELIALAGAELRKWPTATLVERARRFRAPLAPVNGVRDFLADPQVTSNRTVFAVEDPRAGQVRHLRNPVRLGDAPASFRRHPPQLGEHTDEILRLAGYEEGEITALRAAGTVG